MKGTIKADFAGSVTEWRDFASENGFKSARSLQSGPAGGGLPMISLPFKNQEEFERAIAKFAEHGWERNDVIVVRHDLKR